MLLILLFRMFFGIITTLVLNNNMDHRSMKSMVINTINNIIKVITL